MRMMLVKNHPTDELMRKMRKLSDVLSGLRIQLYVQCNGGPADDNFCQLAHPDVFANMMSLMS
jgi:hypothetical protein